MIRYLFASGLCLVLASVALAEPILLEEGYESEVKKAYGFSGSNNSLATFDWSIVPEGLDGNGLKWSVDATGVTEWWVSNYGSSFYEINNTQSDPALLQFRFAAAAVAGGGTADLTVKLNFFESDPSAATSVSRVFTLSDEWETFVTELDSWNGFDLVDPATRYVTLEYGINQSWGLGNTMLWLDNVELEVIPEPASLGLLGIGALMLRRRR